MKCDQFEQRVQDLLDQRFDPGSDTLLRMHADRCDDCRLLLRGFESVVALERQALTVQAAVRPGAERTSWALSTRWAAAALVAASCIGAILAAARLSSMQLNSATSRVVVAVAAVDPLNTKDHSSLSSAPDPAHTASTLAGENDVQRLRDLVAPLADAAGVAAATGGASLSPTSTSGALSRDRRAPPGQTVRRRLECVPQSAEPGPRRRTASANR